MYQQLKGYIISFVILWLLFITILRFTIGITFLYINPFRLQVHSIRFKKLFYIKSARFSIWHKKFIVEKIILYNNTPKHNTNTQKHNNNTTQKHNNNTTTHSTFNKFIVNRLLSFLDNLHVNIKDLNVLNSSNKNNLNIHSIDICLKSIDNILSSESSITHLKIDKSLLCTDFIIFTNSIISFDNNHAISSLLPLTDINIDLKLGNINIPLNELIIPCTTTTTSTVTKQQESSTQEIINIENAIKNLNTKFKKFVSICNNIKEFHFTIDKLNINDIPLTNLSEFSDINDKLRYSLKITDLSFSALKYSSNSPGFKIWYNSNSKPFKITTTLSRLSIYFIIKKPNQDKSNLFKFIDLPTASISGHTNIIEQIYKASINDKLDQTILKFRGQISSPTIELNIDNLAYVSCFKKNLKMFKSIFTLPSSNLNNPIYSLKKYYNLFFHLFNKIIPRIEIDFTLRDLDLLLTDNDDEDILFFKITESTLFAKSKYSITKNNTTSNNNMNLKTIESFTSQNYKFDMIFDILNILGQQRVPKESYRNTFLSLDALHLDQSISILPDIEFNFKGLMHSLGFDLSELRTMLFLGKVLRKINEKILLIEEIYFSELFNKFSTKLKQTAEVYDLYNKESKAKTISPKEILFDGLPEYFKQLDFTLDDFFLALGVRSLFMPPDLFQSLESQSPKDFINGNLRKFYIKMETLKLSIIGDQTVPVKIYHKNNNTNNITDTSSIVTTNSEVLTRIPTEQVELNGNIWSLNFHLQHILVTVVYEKANHIEDIQHKLISDVSDFSIEILPHIFHDGSPDKILINVKTHQLESILSMMNIFFIISSVHTLQQIFGNYIKSNKFNSRAKTYLKSLKKMKKKSIINWKELNDILEINYNIGLVTYLVPLPNGLHTKIDIVDANINIENLSIIKLSGEYFRMCTESPTVKNLWVRMITIVRYNVTIYKDILEKQNHTTYEDLLPQDPAIILENESWHLSIPFKFEMYRFLDNLTTVFKTMKQMIYSFKTCKNDLIIFPHEIKTPSIPKVQLKSGRFIFSLEDDPFEAQLGMIFQIGLEEQKSRLAKIREFNTVTTAKIPKLQARKHKNIDTSVSYNLFDKITALKHRASFPSFVTSKVKSEHETPPGSVNENLEIEHDMPTSYITEEHHQTFNNLQENISKSWIRRIKDYRLKEREEYTKNFSYLWGRINYSNIPKEFIERVQSFSSNPFLLTAILEELDIILTPPKCDIPNISSFIHDIGNGVPKDTKYSIMVPSHIDSRCSELRWHLKDYPIPFLHVPPVLASQEGITEALRIHGDILFTEDLLRSEHELRTLFVPLVPSITRENCDSYYSLLVPRTLTNLKIYSSLTLDVNSGDTTKVTWCESYSPAIQQVMQCFDHFSKPPIDPSKKMGFWDKLRYMMHSRILINWGHGGKLNICLKAGKSPYKMGNKSAGFVLGFEDNVSLSCNMSDEPDEFLSFKAETIRWLIPNYFAQPLLVWCRPSSDSIFVPNQAYSNLQEYASFYGLLDLDYSSKLEKEIKLMESSFVEKTAIKLSGGIAFNVGFVFERKLSDATRSFSYKSHWDTRLCNPIYVPDLQNHDSYNEFRSHFIHMSITLLSKSNLANNSLRLTPGAMQTFLKWWKQFSGNIPVRRGCFFNTQAASPKFGRSLTTISYHIDVSPLFISHIHSNVDADRILKKKDLEFVDFAGIKAKVSQFMMDLHQRKELVPAYNKALHKRKNILKMKFLEGDISLQNIDARAIYGHFEQRTYKKKNTKDFFDIFENDFSWYDRSDFKEAFYIDIDNYISNVYIKPLLYTPQFLFQKRGHHGNKYQLDHLSLEAIEPFDNTVSHSCSLGTHSDITSQLVSERYKTLSKAHKKNKELFNDSKSSTSSTNKQLMEDTNAALTQIKKLRDDMKNLHLHQSERNQHFHYNFKSVGSIHQVHGSIKRFQNRLYIFNMLLKWNEDLRDIITKYLSFFSLRKNFYSLESFKSLKIFDEMINAFKDDKRSTLFNEKMKTKSTNQKNFDASNEGNVGDVLTDIFQNGIRELFDKAKYSMHRDSIVEFIAPQVQLMTETFNDACIILSAPTLTLKKVGFEEGEYTDFQKDKLILNRHALLVNNINCFVLHRDMHKKHMESFYDKNPYGHAESKQWPPWLGVELCLEPAPLSSFAVIKNFSTVVFIDKVPHNITLKTAQSDNLKDRMKAYIPEIVITSNSRSYISGYGIITQLVMHSEKYNVEVKKRIEKLAISYEVKDFAQMALTATQLQENIMLINNLQNEFLFKQKLLDRADQVDLINIHNEKMYELLRLHMLMKVFRMKCREIESNQRSYLMDIHCKKFVLHMLNNEGTSLLDVVIDNIAYSGIWYPSGSTKNSLSIGDLFVTDLGEDVNYRHVVRPYKKSSDSDVLLSVDWELGEPVGGIKVVKRAETMFEGLELQFDEERVHEILGWIFPDEVEKIKNEDAPHNRFSFAHDDSSSTVAEESARSLVHYNQDMNEMLSRSSAYMIIDKLTINDFMLCVSFRGQGTKRLANVTDFVFKFPTLTYTNKAFKLLDLLLNIKKYFTKTLIHQSAKLIETKVFHHPHTHALISSSDDNGDNISVSNTTEHKRHSIHLFRNHHGHSKSPKE